MGKLIQRISTMKPGENERLDPKFVELRKASEAHLQAWPNCALFLYRATLGEARAYFNFHRKTCDECERIKAGLNELGWVLMLRFF